MPLWELVAATEQCLMTSQVMSVVLLLLPPAGITIRMNVELADRPTTCKLILGRIKLGVHKRTVMR